MSAPNQTKGLFSVLSSFGKAVYWQTTAKMAAKKNKEILQQQARMRQTIDLQDYALAQAAIWML
jgi:translation initiation factor IF-3